MGLGKIMACIFAFVFSHALLAMDLVELTPIERQILELSKNHDDISAQAELWLTSLVYDLSRDNALAQKEIRLFAKNNAEILPALCELANHPRAKGNEDVIYALSVSLSTDNFETFLSQLERPDLTTSGVLNLLSVFSNWIIRDPGLQAKILPVLKKIKERYQRDGYIWRLRWGTRRYTVAEENAVLEKISRVLLKTLMLRSSPH